MGQFRCSYKIADASRLPIGELLPIPSGGADRSCGVSSGVSFGGSQHDCSMDDGGQDVLQRVPEELYRKLIEDLKQYLPISLKVCYSMWLAADSKLDNMKFYIRSGPWDSSLVVVTPCERSGRRPDHCSVTLFTMNPLELESVLLKTHYIDWTKPIIFSGVPQDFLAILKKVCEARGIFKILSMCGIYSLNNAEDLIIQLPDEVYVAPLKIEHAQQVNVHWKFGSEKMLSTIQLAIRNFHSVGIFLRETNELVAWMIETLSGSMGYLHTIESHRRRGYASLVVACLAKQIAANGRIPYCVIEYTNSASLRVMEGLGFRKACNVFWVNYLPEHDDVESASSALHDVPPPFDVGIL